MDSSIDTKLNSYPLNVKSALLALRELIFQIAETESLGPVSEDLKWNQLSYSCSKGSPIRIDWDAKSPQMLSLFFNCQTQLVATFREVYPDSFEYSGNRELSFSMQQISSLPEISHCISIALRYHQIKDKVLLGM